MMNPTNSAPSQNTGPRAAHAPVRPLDRAIAASKHADVEGFGLARRGHITLQDHGNVVWYRNIKIREIGAVEQ